MRILTVFFLALLPFCAHGKETVWNFVSNRGPCMPLAELNKTIPEAEGATNPDELLRLVKQRYPDARLLPLLDAVAETDKAEGKPSMNERTEKFWKSVDVANVFSLSVKSKHIELGLMPEEVCKRMQSELR